MHNRGPAYEESTSLGMFDFGTKKQKWTLTLQVRSYYYKISGAALGAQQTFHTVPVKNSGYYWRYKSGYSYKKGTSWQKHMPIGSTKWAINHTKKDGTNNDLVYWLAYSGCWSDHNSHKYFQ